MKINPRIKMILRKIIGIHILLMMISVATAQVSLPRIFQDKMVFQRDEPTTIWGNASAGENIKVFLGSVENKTIADENGNWELKLQAQAAGGPYKLEVSGAENTIVLKDVYMGDVWVLSGQSNAQISFNYFFGCKIAPKYINRFKQDIENCSKEKLIRNYMVATKDDKKETIRNKSENRWFDCNPEDLNETNPIAYYFAREISHNTNVMTAVIRISWGGQYIEEFYQGAKVYRHMLTPWSKMNFKGVIWYQGENNLYKDGDRLGYALKLQLLIRDYRELLNNPKLPFIIVQLPPSTYSSRPFNDMESLPLFLEAQRQVLQIPYTSMAVASDLGMANGLHQPQKYEVAIRIANLALTNIYQTSDATPAGPQFKDFKIHGNKIVVSFETYGSKLITQDSLMPRFFEICAEKKEFKPAQAKIEGNTIVLWNDEIEKPYDVRYGFDESKLMELNLTNTEGIPVAVFWIRAKNQLHPGILNKMKEEKD